MSNQSSLWFSVVTPSTVPTPSTGYYALFIGDGTENTTAGYLYRKDSAGNVSLGINLSDLNKTARDAVGAALQNSGTVSFTYNSGTGAITAAIVDNSISTIKIIDAAITTVKLMDAAVTNAKLANMNEALFKMRAVGTGNGPPIDGTPAQAKTALAITASDVSGLGTAATQPSSAFDPFGAAAAVQAASQPLDADLTAIAALATTAYGRALLTLADAAAFTNVANTATQALKGLMSAADKFKLDTSGVLGNITAPVNAGGTGAATAVLAAQVPANIGVGQPFLLRLSGNAAGAGTVTFRVHAGTNGTTADATVWTSTTSAALATNQRAGFDGLITLRTATTVQCECVGFANTATLPTVTATPATAAVVSTSPWYITLSVTGSALGGGFNAQQAVVQAL